MIDWQLPHIGRIRRNKNIIQRIRGYPRPSRCRSIEFRNSNLFTTIVTSSLFTRATQRRSAVGNATRNGSNSVRGRRWGGPFGNSFGKIRPSTHSTVEWARHCSRQEGRFENYYTHTRTHNACQKELSSSSFPSVRSS